MANPDNETAAAVNKQAEAAMEAMEKQIAQLRREITKINRSLSDQADEAVEEVSGWYDSAAEKASLAAAALRTQAHSVSGAVKENPGTVSSAMLLGGMVGLMLGLVLSPHLDRNQSWFDRR
jgi:malate synthase